MRHYPQLNAELVDQLRAVPPSQDGGLEYRPCAVTLDDGQEEMAVYVVPHAAYIRQWGVLPEDDPGKRNVPLARVRSIRDSPYRLPSRLANELYSAGESGMGYTVFTVEFANGFRRAYVTGNAVDFIDPPPGMHVHDACRVFPHQGREQAHQVAIQYAWCIYEGAGPDNNRMQLTKAAPWQALWRRLRS